MVYKQTGEKCIVHGARNRACHLRIDGRTVLSFFFDETNVAIFDGAGDMALASKLLDGESLVAGRVVPIGEFESLFEPRLELPIDGSVFVFGGD